MYDELVNSLRICGKIRSADDYCVAFHDGCCEAEPVCMYELMMKAADAIEELQADKAALNGTVTNLLEQIKDLGKPHWIPVTERLPFDSGKYLCKIKCIKGEWIEIDYWDGEDWYSTDWHDEKATDVVTHWMPLPEPPKEET